MFVSELCAIYFLNKSRYNAFTALKTSACFLEKGRNFVGGEWSFWTTKKKVLFVTAQFCLLWSHDGVTNFWLFLLLLKYVFWACPEKNLVASLLKHLPFLTLRIKRNYNNLQRLQYFSCFHLLLCFLWLIQVRTSCRRLVICKRIEAELLVHFSWEWLSSQLLSVAENVR